MKIKNTLLLLLVIAALISCGGQSKKTEDPVVYAPAEDPELEKAQQDALENLEYFIKSFNDNIKDTILQYSLKADFIESDEHEHMWISLNKIEDGKYIGYLGNDPQIINNYKYGDLVTITKNQIEDWIIFDTRTGNWEGGYSVKVLQKREQQ